MVFWGLVLEPKKKYTQSVVEKPFHISMASLDLQNCDNSEEFTSVVLRKHDADFILCNLSKKRGIFNANLNLDFEYGGEINFHVIGNSAVHLTGVYIEEEVEFDSDDSMEEEEDLSEDLEGENQKINKGSKFEMTVTKQSPSPKKKIVKEENGTKRKPSNSPVKNAKKVKVESKAKPKDEPEQNQDDDDDEDDDSDFEVSSNDEMMGEEEASDDDDDDNDDDDDDEEEEEDGDTIQTAQSASLSKKQKQGEKAGKPNKQQGGKESPNVDVKNTQQQKKKEKGQANKSANVSLSNGVPKKSVEGGVMVEELSVGKGPVAKGGRMVTVYYVGRLKHNNKQFDASQSGKGFSFRLGRGEVIRGWDVGLLGMTVGSKRRLVIPPKMGYGAAGAPPQIPPNSTLVFDVELKSVK